jgi:LacI family transcriptional regulator
MTALSSAMTTVWRRFGRTIEPMKEFSRAAKASGVTMQDVAALAGVSAKTVSRVVNNQGEIKETTRQRIRAAIEELGYRPNIVARSLINQRTNSVAVVAWGIDYFGPSRTIIGIEQQAESLGYSLFLSLVSDPESDDYQGLLSALLSRRVDGIVWAVPEVGNNRRWFDKAGLADLPPIAFLSAAAHPGMTIVAADNQSGAREATRHLIAQGRRRIGVITGPMAWWEARERHDGWLEALQAAGLEPSPSLVVESYWSSAGGEAAMRQLLAQAPEIDAVCAGSDQIALGALGALHASGRRVPHDVAVAGFDNMPESEFFHPPLTTVNQKLSDVGRISVQLLHHMIEARRDQRAAAEAAVTLVAPELIVRASTA